MSKFDRTHEFPTCRKNVASLRRKLDWNGPDYLLKRNIYPWTSSYSLLWAPKQCKELIYHGQIITSHLTPSFAPAKTYSLPPANLQIGACDIPTIRDPDLISPITASSSVLGCQSRAKLASICAGLAHTCAQTQAPLQSGSLLYDCW